MLSYDWELREHAQACSHTARLRRLTSGAHVDEGVVDQNQFIEVELIGEPLAFGLMKDPLVVVVSGKEHKTEEIIKNLKKSHCAHTCLKHVRTDVNTHIKAK